MISYLVSRALAWMEQEPVVGLMMTVAAVVTFAGVYRKGGGPEPGPWAWARRIIESGTILVRGGRIVSVTPGSAATQGLTIVDAKGMSAMPGFIDSHKHVNTGPNEKGQMQSLLEAGYTTILSGGGPGDGNIILRDRI